MNSSPSTSRKDLREKKNLYERSGVAEYLVLDQFGFMPSYSGLMKTGGTLWAKSMGRMNL